MFKDKGDYPTLTRMSYCQCRLKLVFSSIFKQFGWNHIALLLDRSDLFSLTVGKQTKLVMISVYVMAVVGVVATGVVGVIVQAVPAEYHIGNCNGYLNSTYT